MFILLVTHVDGSAKKKGPVAFYLSTLRDMICVLSKVVVCTEGGLYRKLGLGTIRNLLVSVGFNNCTNGVLWPQQV